MSKPWIHALSSARKFGGKPEDYIEIHNLMDSSKGTIADSRHRALTHNAWFVGTILEKIFGVVITNSDNRQVSVRDIGEQHVLEDFGGRFIPSAQDYLQEIEFQPWMLNGRGPVPPSFRKLAPAPKPTHHQEMVNEVLQRAGTSTQLRGIPMPATTIPLERHLID